MKRVAVGSFESLSLVAAAVAVNVAMYLRWSTSGPRARAIDAGSVAR